MDFIKKHSRKRQFNPHRHRSSSPKEIRKIIEPFTKDQLLDILQSAMLQHSDVLNSVRSVADGDISLRKLFIRGLSSETTSETLRILFSSSGELEEAIVIHDKNTGALMYRMPQASGSGVYPDTGSYALPQHQQPSSMPMPMPPRLPHGAGGMYQGMPPYY